MRETGAGGVPSAATIGRLINRENGCGFAKRYFRADVKRRKKHAKASLEAREQKRKPQKSAPEAEAQAAGKKIIECDMKRVYLPGKNNTFFALPIYAQKRHSIMNREAFIEKYYAIDERALSFATNAKRDGLPALEDEIGWKKDG